MNACEEACLSLASALGPFGELLIFAVAALVAYLSRRQVAATRHELGKAKVEAEAYKTAVLSIRPISEIASLRIPPLPLPKVSAAARASASALSTPPDSDRPMEAPSMEDSSPPND